jgi:FlaA1/EpsC-like NDP-sugar epimerase
MWKYLPINIIFTLIVFWIFRLYHSLWSFAGVTELQNICAACIVSAGGQFLGIWLLGLKMPRSCYIFYGVLLLIFVFADELFKQQKTKNMVFILSGGIIFLSYLVRLWQGSIFF